MIRGLAWRQLADEKLRLLAAVAGITFAVLLQLMQFGFRDALYTSSTLVHARLDADVVLTSSQYEYIGSTSTFTRRRLYQALMLEEVESVTPLHLGITPFKDQDTRQNRQIVVLGLDPDDPALDLAAMKADVEPIRFADAALFDARSRPEFRPVIERFESDGIVHTEVAGRRVDVTGLFELGVSFVGNAHMIVSEATFGRLFHRPPGAIELGLVRVRPGSHIDDVRAALAERLTPDVKVMTRRQLVDLERRFWARNSPIGFIFGLGVFVGLLVGAVIVYQILYTDVSDHMAEYATLKAMGYTDRSLYLVVIQEALILSVFGFPVGLMLAQGIYVVAREATRLPIFMTVPRVLMVFALTATMCGLSGLLAMRKLKSADPAEAF